MAETRQPEPERVEPGSRINPVVFYGSSVCIIAIAVWAISREQKSWWMVEGGDQVRDAAHPTGPRLVPTTA